MDGAAGADILTSKVIDFALHVAILYLACAPERSLVWWVVAGAWLLGHAAQTLAWFHREHAVQGYHTPPVAAKTAAHRVDQPEPLRV